MMKMTWNIPKLVDKIFHLPQEILNSQALDDEIDAEMY